MHLQLNFSSSLMSTISFKLILSKLSLHFFRQEGDVYEINRKVNRNIFYIVFLTDCIYLEFKDTQSVQMHG